MSVKRVMMSQAQVARLVQLSNTNSERARALTECERAEYDRLRARAARVPAGDLFNALGRGPVSRADVG